MEIIHQYDTNQPDSFIDGYNRKYVQFAILSDHPYHNNVNITIAEWTVASKHRTV